MNYRYTAGPLLMAVILLAAACDNRNKDIDRTSAKALYEQQLELTNLFIDSLNRAPDSTQVLALMARYTERMTDCNLDYPPNTDLNLLEGENEQLAIALDSLVRLRNKKLYRFGHPEEFPDSTATDSVAVDSLARKVQPQRPTVRKVTGSKPAAAQSPAVNASQGNASRSASSQTQE